jgi:hypothetical protein
VNARWFRDFHAAWEYHITRKKLVRKWVSGDISHMIDEYEGMHKKFARLTFRQRRMTSKLARRSHEQHLRWMAANEAAMVALDAKLAVQLEHLKSSGYPLGLEGD